MEKVYRFAELNIGICSVSDEIHRLCQSYLTDSSAQFTVQVSRRDIDLERANADRPGYSDAYLETLAVYRKIAEKMPDYDVAFVFRDDEYNSYDGPPWAMKLILRRDEI